MKIWNSLFGKIILTFLISMVPVLELRGAIPIGVAHGLDYRIAIAVSILGNLVPVPFIVLFIRKIFAWLRTKSERLNGFVTRMEQRALKKSDTVRRARFWGLFIFVAIPLPGTGAWTGSLIAAMLEMRVKEAFPPIALGVVTAGIIVAVVLNEDDMTVWWEGMTKRPPKGHLRNWKGEVWDGSDGTRGAHPNSRFTAPAENCPCISEEFFKGTGVPISAIIFGGRRAKTAPLVYQSRDWAHGVFVGATMASETTAAATGAVGVVRRDPMAMRPFCGYNMADYWQHWLDMGEKLPNAPKIFNVNWFRTDDNGRFLWPGFGDNLRVLEWILKRCFDEVGADETVIGYEPKPEDIDLDGSGVTVETLKELLTLDAKSWRENCAGIREYFEQFGDKLPHELREELEALEKAFAE